MAGDKLAAVAVPVRSTADRPGTVARTKAAKERFTKSKLFGLAQGCPPGGTEGRAPVTALAAAKLADVENNNELTLMAVHAHPDDEAIGTGGILARYSAEGVRTVLVTCTNGEQGDAGGGAKPGEPGAATRLAELHKAVGYLGVNHLELLGYRDSGMVGWAANSDPGVFSNVPVPEASARVAALMRQYRPQVVVTYDENGNYGHPDHIQAHRVTVAAAESTGIPAKLYYSTVSRGGFERVRQLLQESGTVIEEMDQIPPDFGTADDQITAVVDVAEYVDQKLRALAAHSSQTENFFLTRLPENILAMVLSHEYFVLRSAPPRPIKEEDLFAGLR
jgi:LmbE family N-acetylglucosaminyl deacetylase